MSIPTDRTSFIQFCLRKLGAPGINIELNADQIDDRVDEALWFYQTYHYDGTEATYYKYKLTSTDITNRYITLPPNIIGAVRIFDLGSAFASGDIFNIQYQIALNDLWNLTNFNLVPFYMAMDNIQNIQQLLIGQQPVRYDRKTNKFWIDTDWNRFAVGDYIVVECSGIVDPNEYPLIWGDPWLQRYTCALIKQTWADVLCKFGDIQLMGGQKYNATYMAEKAEKEIEKYEEEMRNTWQLPCSMIVG